MAFDAAFAFRQSSSVGSFLRFVELFSGSCARLSGVDVIPRVQRKWRGVTGYCKNTSPEQTRKGPVLNYSRGRERSFLYLEINLYGSLL